MSFLSWVHPNTFSLNDWIQARIRGLAGGYFSIRPVGCMGPQRPCGGSRGAKTRKTTEPDHYKHTFAPITHWHTRAHTHTDTYTCIHTQTQIHTHILQICTYQCSHTYTRALGSGQMHKQMNTLHEFWHEYSFILCTILRRFPQSQFLKPWNLHCKNITYNIYHSFYNKA